MALRARGRSGCAGWLRSETVLYPAQREGGAVLPLRLLHIAQFPGGIGFALHGIAECQHGLHRPVVQCSIDHPGRDGAAGVSFEIILQFDVSGTVGFYFPLRDGELHPYIVFVERNGGTPAHRRLRGL